jgi:hypothetical protein
VSYFVAGILRIILLEASAALLVMRRAFAGVAAARARAATLIVAALAVFAFTNFGQLRGSGPMVHAWEQAHFFLGSKYLAEIGYFDIYKAIFLADREGARRLGDLSETRDLRTFDLVPLASALADGDNVRARFSDERWAAFKEDWEHLSSWPAPWRDVVSDHGNSGSPAWALVALPFVKLCGSEVGGQRVLGALDMVLMVALFAFLFATFGSEAGAVGLTVWALMPFCFDYLAGSILRWDWLFATGMAFGFWRRGKPFVAGAFLGYAVVSKLFPIAFAVALGVWLLAASVRARRLDRALVRVVAGAALAAAIFVAAPCAAFGGTSVWRGYLERIDVTQHEKFYGNQYSLKTVYLQLAESRPREVWEHLFRPREIKQSLARVPAGADATGLLLTRLALTALILLAVVRGGPIEALGAGPFLVYVWLTVNAYYWNMLGLTALSLATRRERLSAGLLALHATLAAFYLYQHLNMGFAEGYFVGLLLLGVIIVWALDALAQRQTAAAAAAAAPQAS